jgi:DNA-binding CsgD family transcriptional regulator
VQASAAFVPNYRAQMPYPSMITLAQMPASTSKPSLPYRLTSREEEVLHWIAEGKSNWDIGRILGCAEETVKKHVQHIFRKLGVETRTAAANCYRRSTSAQELHA